MANGENDIDSLARMVADGFSAAQKDVREGFEDIRKEMNERFDEFGKSMDERFDGIEKEVRATNQRIDRVVMPELDSHATRIKDLEVHTGIHA